MKDFMVLGKEDISQGGVLKRQIDVDVKYEFLVEKYVLFFTYQLLEKIFLFIGIFHITTYSLIILIAKIRSYVVASPTLAAGTSNVRNGSRSIARSAKDKFNHTFRDIAKWLSANKKQLPL